MTATWQLHGWSPRDQGPYDTACFHAQQAAEKYLKGFLAQAGKPFPFTHNLEQLEFLCSSISPAPDLSAVDVALLTPYAVQLRYDPAFWPEQATAQEALMLAERVRQEVLAVVPPQAKP